MVKLKIKINFTGRGFHTAESCFEESDFQINWHVSVRGDSCCQEERSGRLSGDTRVCHEGVYQQNDCCR